MKKALIISSIVLAVLIAVAVWYFYFFGQNRDVDFEGYFNWSDFDSPDTPGSAKKNMDRDFLRTLVKIRKDAGIPFYINSAYRTPQYNSTLANSVENSAHTTGMAVDIAAPTENQKRIIAKSAKKYGIERIGWGNSFIHLDSDNSKPSPAVWGYGNSIPGDIKTLVYA